MSFLNHLSPLAWFSVFAGFALILILFFAWWRRRRLKAIELETIFAQVGEWSIRYHTSGRGPNLLLLHGIGANLYCWRWLIPELRPFFRVTAFDLPGFGASSKPKTATYGLDDQCARVIDFMNALKIDKTFIVGNSMGGNIALWLARKYPNRILGVGVIAPAASPALIPVNLNRWSWLAAPLSLTVNRPAMRWMHGRIVSQKDRIDDARIEESIRTYSRRPEAVRSFLRATEAIRDPRLPGELRGMNSRVLLLWGSGDRLVSKKVMDGLRAALPEAKSHFHEGGGHHLQEDDPQWVAGKIVQFFATKPD